MTVFILIEEVSNDNKTSLYLETTSKPTQNGDLRRFPKTHSRGDSDGEVGTEGDAGCGAGGRGESLGHVNYGLNWPALRRRRDDRLLYRRPAELPELSHSRHQELKSTSLI